VHLSLRQRVLLLLVAINVAVVGAEVVFLARGIEQTSDLEARRHVGELASTLRGQVRPETGLNVLSLLQFNWDRFDDAILLDRQLVELPSGRLIPTGVAISPKGALHRAADFDHQSIYSAIRLVLRSGRELNDVEGGRVVPIEHETGVWGALWYRTEPRIDITGLVVNYFLPIFLFSTILLSGVTFVALRHFVLGPVGKLAHASRRVAEGDLSVHVAEPERRDELSELVRTFNAMTTEVRGAEERLAREVQEATAQARQAEAAAMTQRRLAATGELAAGIAHEINNPLGGLQNAVESLARDDLPPEKRVQYLGLLRGGLERIRRTVGQLLRFTPRHSSTAPVSLAQPVMDAVALVRHRAASSGVVLRIECGGLRVDTDEASAELQTALGGLPMLEGEANELGQAVLNLLVNALDAFEERDTPAEGGDAIDVHLWAEAGTEADGREVVLEVRDNGPGVSADELARLCDLFFTTKEQGKGSGLGLAIVHNVVVSHGGTLELASEPGRGFRALVRFPIAAAARGEG
jgi:signal transduction histidine kinase